MKAWGRSRASTVDLEGVVKEIVRTLRRYQLTEVYGEAEPLFAQGRVELLDHPQLVRELKNLERRPRHPQRSQLLGRLEFGRYNPRPQRTRCARVLS